MSFLLSLVSSPTKLEGRIGSLRGIGRKRRGQGAVERDGPNNVCTYE
jgi:hypothetical protein